MNSVEQTSIKSHNQKVVLNTIIKNYPISRAMLSELTDLTKGTVSLQANSLIEKNLVAEIGTGVSNGGRKPILLVFNKNAGFSIGIDLGVNYISTILTDLEGNKIFSDYYSFEYDSLKALQLTLIERIELVAHHAPESPYGIIGIGIAVHGFVSQNETVLYTPHSNWEEVNLKTLLKDHFHCPIFIDNEANAGAFGEKLYGAMKNFKSSIYVSVGAGVGLGIIVNNELYRGSDGFSGEMGHMTIELNGKKCGCGNQGCWEMYASERAFYIRLSRVKKLEDLTVETVSKLLLKNDGETLKELETFSYYLGAGLTNIINTFNPESIILRSSLIEANPIILKLIKNTVSKRISKYIPLKQEIFISQLGINASALGAASFMVKEFLAEPGKVYSQV